MKRIKKINETVIRLEDNFKVKTSVDVPVELINDYKKKVEKESGKDPLEIWGAGDLAEELVKWTIHQYLTLDNLPIEIALGDGEVEFEKEKKVEKEQETEEEEKSKQPPAPKGKVKFIKEEMKIKTFEQYHMGEPELGGQHWYYDGPADATSFNFTKLKIGDRVRISSQFDTEKYRNQEGHIAVPTKKIKEDHVPVVLDSGDRVQVDKKFIIKL